MSRQMSHPVFARVYARLRPTMDRQGAGEHRTRVLAGITGRVVEVGAGDGANFTHYPLAVTEVVAIEPDPYLRAQAAQRAAEADKVQIEVVDGTAEQLPVADGSADVVVMYLVLCSVSDQAAGFVIEELDRFDFPPGQPSPAAPHVLGRATREVAA